MAQPGSRAIPGPITTTSVLLNAPWPESHESHVIAPDWGGWESAPPHPGGQRMGEECFPKGHSKCFYVKKVEWIWTGNSQSRSRESCGNASGNYMVTDKITKYDNAVLLCKAHIISYFKITKQHNRNRTEAKACCLTAGEGLLKGKSRQVTKGRRRKCQLTPNLGSLSGPGLKWSVQKSPINWFLFATGEIDGLNNLPS